MEYSQGWASAASQLKIAQVENKMIDSNVQPLGLFFPTLQSETMLESLYYI